MMTLPRPPLRHRAVVERNVETGLSPTRSPLPARFEVHDAALPCHLWEVENVPGRTAAGLLEGPNVDIVVEGLRMLVKADADIDVNDEISQVSLGTRILTAHRMRVVKHLIRETHAELALELVRAGVQPVAVS